jgi:hypothetical protein
VYCAVFCLAMVHHWAELRSMVADITVNSSRSMFESILETASARFHGPQTKMGRDTRGVHVTGGVV